MLHKDNQNFGILSAVAGFLRRRYLPESYCLNAVFCDFPAVGYEYHGPAWKGEEEVPPPHGPGEGNVISGLPSNLIGF